MKRHHIAALALILFAGLYLYQSFRDGMNDLPIWGIGFIFVAVVAFFYERWKSWLMSKQVVFSETPLCVVMLIILGGMLVRSLVIGDTIGTVGWIGALIAGSIYMALRNIKKVRAWLRFIPFIAVGALLITEIFSLFGGQRDTDIKAMSPPVGTQPRPRVESAPSADTNRQALSSLRQKTMDILTSDEVREEIRAAADAGEPHEALESLSSFKDFMVSKGMTEFSMLDEASSHFQKIFQKHHPDKVPSDLDAEMQGLLIEMIQEFGVDAGRDRFVRTPKVAIWAAARFDLFQQGGKTVSTWMDGISANDFGNTSDIPSTVSPPSVISQDSIPSDTSMPDVTFTETENVSSDREQPSVLDALDSPAIPQTETDAGVAAASGLTDAPQAPTTPPTVEGLEASLKEQFSSERFERAMSTLEQYGPEEGLRRLRENDPEVAKQIEQHRNRSRSGDSDKSEEVSR